MDFQPYIENRKEHYRKCNCGNDHQIKIIRGMFHYSENSETVFCTALIEHDDEKHIWVSFITGEWPNTGMPDCYVTYHVWSNTDGRIMEIKDSVKSPFEKDEVFDCYPVTREQVLAVDGGKEWVINTYLQLFEIDSEIGEFIDKNDYPE